MPDPRDLREATTAFLRSVQTLVDIGDHTSARALLTRVHSQVDPDQACPGFVAVIELLAEDVAELVRAYRLAAGHWWNNALERPDPDDEIQETLSELVGTLVDEPDRFPLGLLGLQQALTDLAAGPQGLLGPEVSGLWSSYDLTQLPPGGRPAVTADQQEQFILECLGVGLLVQRDFAHLLDVARDPFTETDGRRAERAPAGPEPGWWDQWHAPEPICCRCTLSTWPGPPRLPGTDPADPVEWFTASSTVSDHGPATTLTARRLLFRAGSVDGLDEPDDLYRAGLRPLGAPPE